MRAVRLLVCVSVALGLWSSPAHAQVTSTFQQITVSSTAVGIGATTLRPNTAGALQMGACLIRTEDADIRWRTDGTPTASVGNLLVSGEAIAFNNARELASYRMIRVSGDAATTVACVVGDSTFGLGIGGSATVNGGDASAANQDTMITHLAAIETAVEGTVVVGDGSGALNVICDSGCSGGAQYTEGDTDATITGPAILFEGAANTLVAAPGTAANGLLVDVSRVTGTVVVGDGSGALNVIVDSSASHAVTNAGTFVVQVDGDALTALNIIDNIGGTIFADDADFADGTSAVLLSGCVAESAGARTTVTDGDVGACAMTLNRGIWVTIANSSGVELVSPDKAEDAAHTDGDLGPVSMAIRDDTLNIRSGAENDYEPVHIDSVGATWTHMRPVEVYKSIDLDESEEEVDDNAGEVCGMWVTNRSTATVYIHIYDADADDVTVGTTAANILQPVPGNANDDISGSFLMPGGACRVYSNLSIAATTDLDDGSPGAPAANDVLINVWYRSAI